jgi:hypothetical protein
MPTQIGSSVPNARAHVPKTADTRAIMGLHDAQAAHLMPARRADKRLKCGYNAASALLTTCKMPLQCRATRQGSAIPQTDRRVAG